MVVIPTMTMTDFSYVRLRKNVFVCNGYCHSLIMDCNTHKLFQLDSEANDLLRGFLHGKAYSVGANEKADELVGFLKENHLIDFTEKHIKSVLLPPKTQASLQTVWLELRRNCNMHCIHCYNGSNPCAETENPLTVEQWQKIISQLQAYRPNTIILIGGEPLLYNRIVELIKYIKEKLIDTTLVLYSNLTLLDDEMIDVIKLYDVKIVTSIYADNADTHDSITAHKGSFAKTSHNIKRLREHGVDVKANTVIMKNNQDIMERTVKYIKSLTDKTPKIDEIRNTDERLNPLIPSRKINKNSIRSIQNIHKPYVEKIQRSLSGNPCWQGKINISYDGYVSPCIMQLPEMTEAYNLKMCSLKAVLDQYLIPNYWEISKDTIETCCVCEFRYLCNDCRPLAASLTARANNCSYNPFVGKWIQNGID